MKKILLIPVLSICFLMVANTVFSSETWWDDAVDFCIDAGYMQGDANGEFYPENNITRAELSTVIVRITGVEPTIEQSFVDVVKDEWYEKSIAAAYQAGYITGDTEGTFRPDDMITRQEAAVVVHRAFPLPNENAVDFVDQSEIAEWAKDAVGSFSNEGYINGYEDNSFRPNNYITRAEFATIISKIATNVYSDTQTSHSKAYDGNLIITQGNITLSDVNVNGYIYITKAINGGEEIFSNVIAEEGIILCGGNNSRLMLENTASPQLIVSCDSYSEIGLTGNSAINSIWINSLTNISAAGFSGEKIHKVNANSDCSIDMPVEEVIVYGNSKIVIEENAVIDKLIIDENAQSPEITVKGEVNNSVFNAMAILNGRLVYEGEVDVDTELDEIKNIEYSYSGYIENGVPGGSLAGEWGNDNEKILLNGLSLSDSKYYGEISPAFDKKITSYTIKTGNENESVDILCSFDPDYDVVLADEPVVSGKVFTINNISVGENKYKILMYDGIQKATEYTITIIRAERLSDDILKAFDNKIGSLTANDFSECSVTSVNDICMDEYNSELANARVAKNDFLTQGEIQNIVNTVNNTTIKLSGFGVKNSSLYVNNIDFGKNFVPNEYEMNIKVDYGVDNVTVYPKAIANGTSIEFSDNTYQHNEPIVISGLNCGENIFEFTTFSKDKEILYKLNIIRDTEQAITQNIYFNDGLSGYSSSIAEYDCVDSYIVLDSRGETATLSNSQYITLSNGEELSIKINAKANGRVPVKVQVIDADNNITLIKGMTVTQNAKDYEFTYSCSDVEGKDIKVLLTFNGCLKLSSLEPTLSR